MTTPQEYEDKLLDVMQYVKMKLDDRKVRLKFRSKDDIERSIRGLDASRRGGKPRMSDDFIQSLLETDRAGRLVGKTLGSRGPVREFRGVKPSTVVPVRVVELRSQGKDVVETREGFLSREVFKRGERVRVVFRNVDTGRFVKAPSGDS